jgi:hypothetical protein
MPYRISSAYMLYANALAANDAQVIKQEKRTMGRHPNRFARMLVRTAEKIIHIPISLW